MRAHRRFITPIAVLAAAGGCSVQQTPPQPAQSAALTSVRPFQPSPSRDLTDEINRFSEDSASFNRFYTLRWSEATLDKQEAFLNARLDELRKLDLSALSQTGRVDAILLRNEIRADLSRLRLSRRQLTEMNDLLTVRSVVARLEESRLGIGPVLDAKSAADAVDTIPELVKAARAHADTAKPTAVTAQRAAAALGTYNAALRAWYDHTAGYTPDFAWWNRSPYEEARRAIDDFARYLREDIAGLKGKPADPLVGDPIGRDALLDELKNEAIALSPEELIELGEREMAWCTQQAEAAAREMGLTDKDGKGDWKAALAKVKKDVPPPGEQAAYAVGVAREAIEFVKKRDLVTVPPMCEELWRASMLSPETQRTLPFAVYFPQAIGIAAPTDAMSHDDKLMSMRGNNRRFTRIVVPHELIPGHHLQSFMAAREKPYRRRFSTPFYVEGWALYWEMKLWDLDWGKSPEDRLGMLFWRMHRCARITVSLKFHLGEMTPPQMIDYLMQNVGHERANATAEVRRYVGSDYGPLYQAGYMVGGKQLRALHQELVGGGRMTEKSFNDAVLKLGPIPIELVRAELTDAPLTMDSEASWKFDPR